MAGNYTALQESAQVPDAMPVKSHLKHHGMVDQILAVLLD
jgi:hypothetical protein